MATKYFKLYKSEYADDCGASNIEYLGIEEEELNRIATKLRELKQVEAIKDCFKVSYLYALSYEYYDEDKNKLEEVDFRESGVSIDFHIYGIGSIDFKASEKYTDEYLWADILYLKDGEVNLCDEKEEEKNELE